MTSRACAHNKTSQKRCLEDVADEGPVGPLVDELPPQAAKRVRLEDIADEGPYEIDNGSFSVGQLVDELRPLSPLPGDVDFNEVLRTLTDGSLHNGVSPEHHLQPGKLGLGGGGSVDTRTNGDVADGAPLTVGAASLHNADSAGASASVGDGFLASPRVHDTGRKSVVSVGTHTNCDSSPGTVSQADTAIHEAQVGDGPLLPVEQHQGSSLAQLEIIGALLQDGNDVDDAILQLFADLSDSAEKYGTSTFVDMVKSLSQTLKDGPTSLCNVLISILSILFCLVPCATKDCNLFAQKGGKHCMKCANEQGDDEVEDASVKRSDISPTEGLQGDDEVEDTTAEWSDNPPSVGVTEQQVENVCRSVAWENCMDRPCDSPKKKGDQCFNRTISVRDELPSHQSNIRSMILSHRRGFQLHLIPLVVYIIMLSLGYERKKYRPLRELIVKMVLEEQLPQKNSFYFCKLPKVQALKKEHEWEIKQADLLKHVSLVVRAASLVLDLFAYAESFSMLELLANIFLLDGQLLQNNEKLVFLLASLSFAMQYNSNTLVEIVKSHHVESAGGGRVTYKPRTLRLLVSGDLNRSLIRCLGLFGFYPLANSGSDLIQKSNSRFQPFLRAVLGGRRSAMLYLDSLRKSGCPIALDILVDATVNNDGEVMALPLFLLAYGTILKNLPTDQKASLLPRKLSMQGGSKSSYCTFPQVNDGMYSARDVTFRDCSLQSSCEPIGSETKLDMRMLQTFQQTNQPRTLGLKPLIDDLSKMHCKAFSLDFSQCGRLCRSVENLALEIAANPREFAKSSHLLYVTTQLQEFAVKVTSSDMSEEELEQSCILITSLLGNKMEAIEGRTG